MRWDVREIPLCKRPIWTHLPAAGSGFAMRIAPIPSARLRGRASCPRSTPAMWASMTTAAACLLTPPHLPMHLARRDTKPYYAVACTLETPTNSTALKNASTPTAAGYPQKFSALDTTAQRDRPNTAFKYPAHGETGYRYFDKSVTETTCKFIAERQNSDRPYALVVGYINPHNPLICGREDFEYYMAQIPPLEPESPEYLNTLHPAMKKWRERRGVDDITPEQNRRGLAAYYGLTTELDRYIGQIIDTVQSSSDADNTVIIYTSDHGDMAHEHGMWWKSSFYEGSVGIPLICSWPSYLRENHTEDAIVSLIDVGPTALDIAGADPMPDVSGKSFASFLTGDPPSDWPNEVFAEYIGLLGDQPACMIRTGPWKLNYYSEFDSCQLFNIDEDPEERRDLSNDPRYQDVIQSGLKKIFARWSADDILKQAERQARARALIARCGHSHIPHAIPPFSPDIDEVNEFDFSQLPEDPR